MDNTFKEAYEHLSKYGVIYINHWSTDCDGCSSAGHREFKTIEDLEAWLNSSYEWADGDWGWDYGSPDNLVQVDPRGYWGM